MQDESICLIHSRGLPTRLTWLRWKWFYHSRGDITYDVIPICITSQLQRNKFLYFFFLPLTLFSSDQNVSSQTCYLHANYTGVEDTHSETVTFTRDYLSWYHSITKDSGVIWRTHEVLHFLRQVPKCAVKLHIKISHFTLGQTLQWG